MQKDTVNPIDNPADAVSTLVFRPLGRKNAYEEVSEQIRRLILTQKLSPSHRLPTERDLAEQFGVSRVVIREAIRSLECSGLLTVKKGPRGGIFAAQQHGRPITDSIMNLLIGGTASLTNLFEMRLLIEPYAAFRAAEQATPPDLDALEAILREGEKAGENFAEIRAHNIDFHRTILHMSRNPVMAVIGDTVLRILSDRIEGVVSRRTTLTALGMHKRIFEALRNHQAAQAEALMRKDIQVTGQRLSELGPETLAKLAVQQPSELAPL
ncbi:MAG: FadR family transcriptional regulator [Zoogloeaceae bacterium]|jgi:GntR family transcriptional repressor for pyruvate dehydrogenase complex|nr:FadR family transcriptional regulator [Zoogloeaceae bacterium]